MTWRTMAVRENAGGLRKLEETRDMWILKISGMVLHAAVRLAADVLQLALAVLAACVSFGGSVLQLIGRILGTLFVGSSILCLIMGLVTGREFWEMFLLGIAFGAIPAALQMLGEGGIHALRRMLSRIYGRVGVRPYSCNDPK